MRMVLHLLWRTAELREQMIGILRKAGPASLVLLLQMEMLQHTQAMQEMERNIAQQRMRDSAAARVNMHDGLATPPGCAQEDCSTPEGARMSHMARHHAYDTLGGSKTRLKIGQLNEYLKEKK